MIPIQYFYSPFGSYFPSVPYIQPFFEWPLDEHKHHQLKLQSNNSIEIFKEEGRITECQPTQIRNASAEQPKKQIIAIEKKQFGGKKNQKLSKAPQKKITQISKEKKQKQQRQIEGRNANSNLLRMFFRRLDQIFQTQTTIIKRIIVKNKMKISDTKFLEWFQINKAQYTNYIRLPCVKKLFICNRVNRSGKFQTKIMRILLDDFLRKEAHCFYLTSKKIKRSAMSHNYGSIRNILKQIVEEQSDL